jgi:hypothetical protein
MAPNGADIVPRQTGDGNGLARIHLKVISAFGGLPARPHGESQVEGIA